MLGFFLIQSQMSSEEDQQGQDFLFDIYGVEGRDYFSKDGKIIVKRASISLKPELSSLYEEIGVINAPQKTVVIFPIFTSSAYEEPGFYTYFRGECDSACLTTKIEFANRPEASGIATQVLTKLGYTVINDIAVDKDPKILDNFDKVILLHNEYVTQKEFEAITNHPKVIYLYPNALYAEVEVNYDKQTISLIKGHNYPKQEIINGFNWKFDNSKLEYDLDCKNWQFYEIDNGIMLNCNPESLILQSAELLKAIKNF